MQWLSYKAFKNNFIPHLNFKAASLLQRELYFSQGICAIQSIVPYVHFSTCVYFVDYR